MRNTIDHGEASMSIRPAITVVTPTFNRRASLERAIRSVQRQSRDDYEHIIVDDGSNDATHALVRRLADPRIRFIRFEQRRGANAARNAGIEAARSELVTFLDSDDEYLPHRLASTVEHFAQPNVSDLLISSFQTTKGGERLASVNPTVTLSGSALELVVMAYGIFIAGSAITARRAALRRAGGFDPALRRLQDRDMILRMSRQGGALLRSTVDWVKHPSPDSISAPRAGYVSSLGAMLESHPDMARRHRDLIAYHVARHACADLLRGRWWFVHQALRENGREPMLRFTLGQLVSGYRAGSTRRRSLIAALRQRSETGGRNAASEPCSDGRPVGEPALRRAA